MKYINLFGLLLLVSLAACMQKNSAAAPMAVGPETLNVADAAIAGGDPAMALSVSQSVLDSNPNDVDALLHEGDAYYALQRCPDSVAAYTLALKEDPKSSAAETGIGRCLIKVDPKSAEATLMLAIQDDPGNADALNDLGVARDLQGNFAGASGPYQQALLTQPGLTAVEVNFGLSLALSGNGPEALQYLGPLATGPEATPKIRQNYAAALVACGRDTEARQVLSIDLPPDQVNKAMQVFSALIVGSVAPVNTSNTRSSRANSTASFAAVSTQSVGTTSAFSLRPILPTVEPVRVQAVMPITTVAPATTSDTAFVGSSTMLKL